MEKPQQVINGAIALWEIYSVCTLKLLEKVTITLSIKFFSWVIYTEGHIKWIVRIIEAGAIVGPMSLNVTIKFKFKHMRILTLHYIIHSFIKQVLLSKASQKYQQNLYLIVHQSIFKSCKGVWLCFYFYFSWFHKQNDRKLNKLLFAFSTLH